MEKQLQNFIQKCLSGASNKIEKSEPLTKVLLQAGLDEVVRPEKVMIGLFYTGIRKKNLLFHEK